MAGKPPPPLSQYAKETLAYCARVPTVPSYESNPGVWDKLFREGLVEQAGNSGGRRLYRITQAGRGILQGSSDQ